MRHFRFLKGITHSPQTGELLGVLFHFSFCTGCLRVVCVCVSTYLFKINIALVTSVEESEMVQNGTKMQMRTSQKLCKCEVLHCYGKHCNSCFMYTMLPFS